MKNILKYFYFFSKLSVSIFLLFALIFCIYLFYNSYSSISFKEEQSLNKNENIIKSINLNASKIQKLELILKENNAKLTEIFESLDQNYENNNKNLVLEEIKNDFNKIEDELKKLQTNLSQIQSIKDNKTQTSLKNVNKENTIQLINLKFENGRDFSVELELLSKILGSKKIQNIEKLYLINNNGFMGSDLLLSNFKKEIDFYISSNLIKKNKLIDVILPYITIEPSKVKQLSDSRLIVIDNIIRQLEEKNYLEAKKSIKLIEENEKFFKLTIKQLLIAVEFKNTLEEIIQHG